MDTVRNRNTPKVVKSFAVAAVLAVGAVGGTFAAFTATTENTGNFFDADQITLTDNDSDTALYEVTDGVPGVATTSCVTVTYGGTTSSQVELYVAETIGTVGPYVDLLIEYGTGAATDCNDFSSDGTEFSGTLAAFDTAHSSNADGLVLTPPGGDQWDDTETVTYRFTVTLQDDDAAQGLTSGTHTFTWESTTV